MCNISTDNPLFQAAGWFINPDVRLVTPEAGNVQNFTFSNCIAGDIFAPLDATGFNVSGLSGSITGTQGSLTNVVLQNCIAERIHSDSLEALVAGIALIPIDE